MSTEARGKPSTLVEAMTQNARGLSDISEDFVHVAPKYAIKTVYETLPLAATGQLVVPMLSTRMFGHKQDEVPTDADHLSMCQFSDADDADFLMVSAFIRRATEGDMKRPISTTSAHRELEEVGVRRERMIQGNQTSKTQIGLILGQALYIDTPPMRQRPSIMRSHEGPLLPAPTGRNTVDTKVQAAKVPLALPVATPQSLRKDMPVPRVVPVECESESTAKQPRWFSRVMVGIRSKGGSWR